MPRRPFVGRFIDALRNMAGAHSNKYRSVEHERRAKGEE